ncbi:hypothetical protein [Rhodococcoides yunnanense]|uniref:hypothetical protein n=1 Tax=Rhodococcoides yunnanense TaxID=278209 RepID=UPI0012E29319|nr:hypothetical protein [Rhodococcus yunnanensis]
MAQVRVAERSFSAIESTRARGTIVNVAAWERMDSVTSDIESMRCVVVMSAL